MTLVDTSVWIDHFRKPRRELIALLTQGEVLIHPHVLGELACGNLEDRTSILADLSALTPANVASNAEAMDLLEKRKLWGRGLGWIDVHLLASASISHCKVWTLDRRLAAAAEDLGLN